MGINQGDPLTLFLFILVVERLSGSIKKGISSRMAPKINMLHNFFIVRFPTIQKPRGINVGMNHCIMAICLNKLKICHRKRRGEGTKVGFSIKGAIQDHPSNYFYVIVCI